MSTWKDIYTLYGRVSDFLDAMSPEDVEENNRLSKAVGQTLEQEMRLASGATIAPDTVLTPGAEERFMEWKAFLQKQGIA